MVMKLFLASQINQPDKATKEKNWINSLRELPPSTSFDIHLKTEVIFETVKGLGKRLLLQIFTVHLHLNKMC